MISRTASGREPNAFSPRRHENHRDRSVILLSSEDGGEIIASPRRNEPIEGSRGPSTARSFNHERSSSFLQEALRLRDTVTSNQTGMEKTVTNILLSLILYAIWFVPAAIVYFGSCVLAVAKSAACCFPSNAAMDQANVHTQETSDSAGPEPANGTVVPIKVEDGITHEHKEHDEAATQENEANSDGMASCLEALSEDDDKCGFECVT
ncbi:hypothetical protein ERJ75_000275800 [Trypanosoma vivax]|nr:hypothetical protein TRVL_01870 [Trypanosoma vivax]KAH8618385.1 hypothetical protein ERJ75_000275800 [Trypanosoma vivax]